MSGTKWHWIITVQCHLPDRTRTATRAAVLTVAPGTSRADVYFDVLQDVAGQLGVGIADLTTVFFSLEPDQL